VKCDRTVRECVSRSVALITAGGLYIANERRNIPALPAGASAVADIRRLCIINASTTTTNIGRLPVVVKCQNAMSEHCRISASVTAKYVAVIVIVVKRSAAVTS